MTVPKPLDILVAGLAPGDEVVQADAARLIGDLGRPEGVAPLVEYVTTSRHYCKAAGIDALARIGEASVCATLSRLVDEPNVDDDWFWYCRRAVRAAGAVALLALGDDSRAGYLQELADKDDDVLLCWYGPAVLRLSDRLEAARAVKARITVEAIEGGGSRRTRSSEPATLAMKAETLGLIATPEACELLKELMTFHSRYVRGQAALSLLHAGPTEEHVSAVAAMADGDAADFARLKAALALALMGEGDRAAFLARAAQTLEDPFDRAVAVEALGLIGADDHAPEVREQLSHADAYVRQCALESLERIDPAGAAADAERCLGDENIRVRLQAAKCLAARDGEIRP